MAFLERMKAQKKEAYQKGIQKGIEKGIQKGALDKKLEIAKTMLFKGLEIPFIAEITKLSIEEVKQLKKDLTH